MKIQILVLSCLADPYDKLMAAQQETWDSIEVPNVSTMYYYGGGAGLTTLTSYSKEFGTDSLDNIESAHWKYRLALQEAIKEDWDFIFRTNSSSYIDKKRLVKFARSLPSEKCYCGIDGDGFASGAGYFISRDCAKLLINSIQEKLDLWMIEDVYTGQLLAKEGISVTPGAQRVDYYWGEDPSKRLDPAYHFRCKSNTEDRSLDIKAFDWLFENNTDK